MENIDIDNNNTNTNNVNIGSDSNSRCILKCIGEVDDRMHMSQEVMQHVFDECMSECEKGSSYDAMDTL